MAPTATKTPVNAPVILDLGKASRKNIRRLKKGQGKLVDEVQDAIREVASSLGDQTEGKELLPVVLIYRRKARRRGRGLLPLLF